jgi:hypothetical protein
VGITDVADTDVLRAPEPANVGGVGVVDLHPQAQTRESQDEQVAGDDPVSPAEVLLMRSILRTSPC